MVLKCNRIGFENDDVGPDVSKFGAEFNAKEFEPLYEEEKRNPIQIQKKMHSTEV